VLNQARFSAFGRECEVNVDGIVEAVAPAPGRPATRFKAIFKDGELIIGDGIGRTRYGK
jgi:hypothetical protein